MLGELRKIRDHYSQFPFIRRSAIKFSGINGNDQVEKSVRNLADFVRAKVKYVEDPVGYELVTAPDVLLADILQKGFGTGDCDDHALLYNTMLMSIGVPAEFAAVRLSQTDPEYNHVISLVTVRGQVMQVDPTAKFRLSPTYTDLYV